MIANIGAISVDSVTYVVLAGCLAALAWSRWKNLFLYALVVSGGMLALSWLGWKDLLAMALFMVVPYLAAWSIWGQRNREAGVLIAGVVIWQVFLFLVIKQYPFANVLTWFGHPVTVIGVSYILFRQLHLVVDARFLGHLPLNPIRYAGFILSPWTLIAGPIQRYDAFCSGLETIGRPATEELLSGAHRVVNGLLLAFVAAPVFLEPSRISNLTHTDAGWIDFLIVYYGFPIYLYLNFAGYTSIMIGCARICGFSTLPENFHHPYLASNTRDFWARWHMSFGAWIKTYVFTPACARLMKASAPRYHWLMMLISVLLAFYVVGIWHGTTVNYLIFGIVQGLGVICSALFEHWRKRLLGVIRSREFNQVIWFQTLSILITLHFTCLSFLLLNDHPDRLIDALEVFFS